MVDLYELKQLTAFVDLGTLSRVAEAFHISTPSVTRSMQQLERYFGVPLFRRGKNRIELNETGRLAVECARKLLQEAEQAVEQVRAFDQRQRTLVVKSCAPAPLWELLRRLNAEHPEKMVASAVCQNEERNCRQAEFTHAHKGSLCCSQHRHIQRNYPQDGCQGRNSNGIRNGYSDNQNNGQYH